MKTVFTRQAPPTRLAATEHGDTIQSIAGRELGDTNRWPELAWINGLRWPYVSDDPSRAGAGSGVLLNGGFIRIPAPVGRPRNVDTGQVFERDCLLHNKKLDIENGDFSVITGSSNLAQQLQHRIATPRGQLVRHPRYGSLLYRLLGTINGPTGGLMATQYATATIQADYRIRSLLNVAVDVKGDSISVRVKAETIAGGPIDIQTEVT